MPKPPLPDHLQEVLSKPNPAVIGSVRPDGRPHTAATWYLWDDGRVLVNMDEGRKRLDNLRENPHVSITVMDGESWYRHITLEGSMSIEDDTDLSGVDRVSKHYMGSAYSERDRGRVNGWIEVERWHAWKDGRPWR